MKYSKKEEWKLSRVSKTVKPLIYFNTYLNKY